MAVLYITEFVSQGVDLNGRQLPVAAFPNTASQTVAISVSSASSSTFQNNTGLVRLQSDTTCSAVIAIPAAGSTSLTATTTQMRMAAGVAEYFNVPIGNSYKAAVIANS